jgi:hypothetical protein
MARVSSNVSAPMSACKGGNVNQNHWPMHFTALSVESLARLPSYACQILHETQ